MANPEEFDSELNDPNAPAMGATEAEISPAFEEPSGESMSAEVESRAAEAEVAATEKEAEVPGEEVPAEKPPSKWPRYLEIAILILVLLAISISAWQQWIFISTAIYILAVAAIPYALWKTRKTATIYTVFLGCVLAAILTAVYCLWVELGRYDFDIKAQEAKQRTVWSRPALRPMPGERILSPKEFV